MFEKHFSNPIIKRTVNTFYSRHAANFDILDFQGKTFVYFRGQDYRRHDQIGVGFMDREGFDGTRIRIPRKNPVIKVSAERARFDSRHILDPGSVVFENKVFLYYSGHSYDSPACIGLAVSDDGVSFGKLQEPVVRDAIVPEAIVRDGILHLVYQRQKDHVFSLYLAKSKDGKNFDAEVPIFQASGIQGSFDSHSVSTARILEEDGWYYLVYGGNRHYADYPGGFGLARSRDLVVWKRSPRNPILERGKPYSWDEGAIWFGTLYSVGSTVYLWYEGAGAGIQDKEKSKTVREKDYGLYGRESFSQIGLATHSGKLADFF